MSLPTDLPGCGEPAIVVFEVFTRTETGYSLDGRLNVCGAHVVPALTTLRAADFEPHQATSGKEPGRCGDGYDYVAGTSLTAPAMPMTDPRRAALERNLAIAEQSGYSYVVDNNRRLLAALDARAAAPAVAPTTAERSRSLRRLVWSWLPEEPVSHDNVTTSEPEGVHSMDTLEPTTDEQRAKALALLEQVRDAQQFLATWTDRLIQVASDHGATNPQIGARLGVGKERVRRRLLKEPGSA